MTRYGLFMGMLFLAGAACGCHSAECRPDPTPGPTFGKNGRVKCAKDDCAAAPAEESCSACAAKRARSTNSCCGDWAASAPGCCCAAARPACGCPCCAAAACHCAKGKEFATADSGKDARSAKAGDGPVTEFPIRPELGPGRTDSLPVRPTLDPPAQRPAIVNKPAPSDKSATPTTPTLAPNNPYAQVGDYHDDGGAWQEPKSSQQQQPRRRRFGRDDN